MKLVYYLFLATFVLLHCSAPDNDDDILIGASLLTMQDDFYITLDKGLHDAAAKIKEHHVIVQSRNADLKLSKQISDIEDFMMQNVDLLIVSPVSITALGPTLDEAHSRGIPVITVDIRSETGHVDCHIMSDDVKAGEICGEFAAELLNQKGEIGIITHPVLTSGINRVKGFQKTLEKYPDIQIVSELNAESRREKAMSLMEDMLISHPDVDCVFGINDIMTLGAMASIEGAGRTDDVKAIMICGGQKEAFDRFRTNDPCLKGAALVFPYIIGSTAVKKAMNLLQGKNVPNQVLVPVKLLTHENVDILEKKWSKQE